MLVICYRYGGEQHYVEYNSLEEFHNDFKDADGVSPEGIQPDYVFNQDNALTVEQHQANAEPIAYKTYVVGYKIDGRFSTAVKADSLKQALDIAESDYQCADFGSDVKVVKGSPIFVEHASGGVFWEEGDPIDDMGLPLDKYMVGYAIDGRFYAKVNATTIEEVLKKAEDTYRDADFGTELDVINYEAINVEDEHGSLIWEK